MNRFMGCFTAVGLVLGATGAAWSADYQNVTDERLRNPEPENWLSWRGDDEGWGYSPLEQITKENVKDLVPVWTFSTGVNEGHQAPPIVNGDMMFISTPENQVIALDAKTGDEIWRYRRALPPELFQLHPTNRGVALYEDKVYLATLDACVVALNATTGEELWDTCIGDWENGEYSTLAPLIAGGNVITGVSGGEFGIRGFIAAVDAETGEQAWKTYTVPSPDEPGGDTWKGDDWQTGGGSVWMTGSYDSDSGLAYYGTGNGGPWMPDQRPGDNLYTSSVVAIDVKTGEIKGYHQYHWNDAWDWDEVSAPVLVDFERDGKTIKGAVHAGRNGYLWMLERTAEGPINFVDAKPFVRQEVFASIDPETGRPTYNDDKTPGTDKTVTFCPSLWGGKDWPMEAYNPKTGLFYVPMHENLCSELGGAEMEEREPGELWIGVPIDVVLTSLRLHESVDASKPVELGGLEAWNLSTGEMVWKHSYEDDLAWGPLMTTAGGLVFGGGTVDRKFRAFDADTGEVLWEQRTNSGVTGAASSYEVDGVQYVAVQSGWGVDAERMRGLVAEMLPGRVPPVPQGGVVWVFALKDKAQ